MYSESFNRKNNAQLKSFYRERIEGTAFINFGLVFKFGKVKSAFNNYNMYNALDLNSTDIGNNINTGNNQVPAKENNLKSVNIREVQDLIETQDFY